MLELKQVFGLIHIPKRLIRTVLEKANLSLKKLYLGLEKISKTKNLCSKIRKQHCLPFNLEYLRFIRYGKKKKMIVITIIASKTDSPKKALFWSLKLIFWSLKIQKNRKRSANVTLVLSYTINIPKKVIMQISILTRQKTSLFVANLLNNDCS